MGILMKTVKSGKGFYTCRMSGKIPDFVAAFSTNKDVLGPRRLWVHSAGGCGHAQRVGIAESENFRLAPIDWPTALIC